MNMDEREEQRSEEQVVMARIRTVCALLIVLFWFYTTIYRGC